MTDLLDLMQAIVKNCFLRLHEQWCLLLQSDEEEYYILDYKNSKKHSFRKVVLFRIMYIILVDYNYECVSFPLLTTLYTLAAMLLVNFPNGINEVFYLSVITS